MDAHQDIAVPAKITSLLEYATRKGLTVEFTPDDRPTRYSTIHSWTLRVAGDTTALFIYWSPGKRGGTVSLRVYRGIRGTLQVTRIGFLSWIGTLGDLAAARAARDAR